MGLFGVCGRASSVIEPEVPASAPAAAYITTDPPYDPPFDIADGMHPIAPAEAPAPAPVSLEDPAAKPSPQRGLAPLNPLARSHTKPLPLPSLGGKKPLGNISQSAPLPALDGRAPLQPLTNQRSLPSLGGGNSNPLPSLARSRPPPIDKHAANSVTSRGEATPPTPPPAAAQPQQPPQPRPKQRSPQQEEAESLASKLIARRESEALAKRLIAEREGAPRPPRVEDVTVEKAIEFAALHEERQAERLKERELAMQPQEFNKPQPLKSAMQRRSSFADNNDGEEPPYKAVNKGKKGGGGGGSGTRRLSFEDKSPTRVYYEPCQERPVDNYHQSLHQLQVIRQRRASEGKSDLSFAQTVSELDAQEGGEGLSCLVPRKVDAPYVPGSWMKGGGGGSGAYGSGQMSWDELMAPRKASP